MSLAEGIVVAPSPGRRDMPHEAAGGWSWERAGSEPTQWIRRSGFWGSQPAQLAQRYGSTHGLSAVRGPFRLESQWFGSSDRPPGSSDRSSSRRIRRSIATRRMRGPGLSTRTHVSSRLSLASDVL